MPCRIEPITQTRDKPKKPCTGKHSKKKTTEGKSSSAVNAKLVSTLHNVCFKMAVREGFEPSKTCALHTFQACSFGHSDTSP